MRVLALELTAFRNYAALRFEPPEGACIFVGANAQGKSNLLEALALLSTGKSFRTSREADLVATGAPAASVSARVRTRHGEVVAQCVISRAGEGARKRFFRQGRAVRYGDFLGGVNAVTFMPYDLQLVGGPAALRRRLINTALSQSSKRYYHDLAVYAKILAQKNALLRAPTVDRALLDTYDDQLAPVGARLVAERASYVRRLGAEASDVHARWVGASPALTIRYDPAPPIADEAPAAIETGLRAAFVRMRPAELARRGSLVGPHRDDVSLSLDGEALSRFGSQGQQRTAVLALKAAEYALLQRATGEAPLLLLDDVLSELDDDRRRAFLESIGSFDQAFITATDPPVMPPGASASLIAVISGALHLSHEVAS
ncbi:MAG TPA: DNA replication/repair protein RecF [Candidatus Eremiobacteraceae bacterium]